MAKEITCPRPLRRGVCGVKIINGVCPECGCKVGVENNTEDLPQPSTEHISPPRGAGWDKPTVSGKVCNGKIVNGICHKCGKTFVHNATKPSG